MSEDILERLERFSLQTKYCVDNGTRLPIDKHESIIDDLMIRKTHQLMQDARIEIVRLHDLLECAREELLRHDEFKEGTDKK
jgi:hypothetical protein